MTVRRKGGRGGGCAVATAVGWCVGGACGYAGWWLLSVSDRYLHLNSNQISGSFPSVVSGLSSLTYVRCLQCMCVRTATSVVC